MFSSIQPTRDRFSAVHAFDHLRHNALRASLWAKLSRNITRLANFYETSRSSANRKFIGLQEIPVAQIVGTLSRQADFDNQFRPLNPHLRERWVDVFISFSSDNWAPIQVHKVGEQYYVEDGHHRVSVARAIGMAYLQAEVWEYSAQPATVKLNQSTRCYSSSCLNEACPA